MTENNTTNPLINTGIVPVGTVTTKQDRRILAKTFGAIKDTVTLGLDIVVGTVTMVSDGARVAPHAYDYLVDAADSGITAVRADYNGVSVEIQREYQNWLGSLSPAQRREQRRVDLDSSFSSWLKSLKEV